MPISRYEIRNEYTLADPELYQAADKDDPEALLEGVAMAGLVGVLRQLGDLAEFAAEIFHDLHEEVMATAARGHGLMIRVQQLEAEVPSIEKALLSQTDHSSFLYNAGVDWHPSLRMDQNVVTHGDLPRFVMDSYEECRGPPRLFLLDKFDVAGAGACLKRYTDPSFFKADTSAMANGDVRREKKIRKGKKKGNRGNYGETPEGLPTSHAKLHWLFLEEPDENSASKPAHRPKLKRRLNGFPFDSKTEKSYMEKFLKSPSPEHKMLNEITESSPLYISTNDHSESDLDVFELRSVNPAREIEERRIFHPYPLKEDTVLTTSMNHADKKSVDIKSFDIPSYPDVVTDDIPSTFDEENAEKHITVYGESKMEDSITGYLSDEIASEIDNYMDAPSTIESEMDTDTELKLKNDFTQSYINSPPSVSVETEEHLPYQSSDSQSTGGLTISYEGSNSGKKEVCSFVSSDSSRTSAENQQSEKSSAERLAFRDIPEITLANASAYQTTADENSPRDELPNNRCGFEQLNSDFSTSSRHIAAHNDSGVVVRQGTSMGLKSGETPSTLDEEEKKTNLIVDSPTSCSISPSKSLSEDDSPRSSSGEHLLDGENTPCRPNISDSPIVVSAYSLQEDDNALANHNQLENTTSNLNISNVLSLDRNNTEEIIYTESTTLGKLDDEVSRLSNKFAPDFTDIVVGGEDVASKDPDGERQNDNLYNEYSTAVSDAQSHISHTVTETSLTDAVTLDSKEHNSDSLIVRQISSETMIFSEVEGSLDSLKVGLDSHDREFIPEEVTIINETREVETLKSCEVMGLQATGISDDVTPDNLVALNSTSCMSGNLEEPLVTSESGITELENTQTFSSSYLKHSGGVHVVFDESESKADQSVVAFSENNNRGNVSLPVGLNKLGEGYTHSFEDSSLGEHENEKTSFSGSKKESDLFEEDENHVSGSHGGSGPVEEAEEAYESDAALDYHTDYFSTKINDHPKSEIPDRDFNSHLDSDIEQRAAFLDSAQIQSPLEQSGLDTEHESFLKSDEESRLYVTEEILSQDKIELPSNGINQELPDSVEISSELTTVSPINQQKMPDIDIQKGHDDFASSFPLVDCPPSISAYPRDPLGLTYPLISLFSETNQTNLDELPPLPPLPPLQWRMGMLQHASSITELEKTEPKEEAFKQDFSPPTASIDNLGSLVEPRNQSSVQIIPQISLEENIMQGSSSLEADSMHGQKIDLPPMENEQQQQQQLVTPTQNSDEVASSALLADDEVIPQFSLKEKNVEQGSHWLEDNSTQQTIDLPPKREKEQQQQRVIPAQLSGEVTSSAPIASDEVVPQISLKEKNVEQGSGSLGVNTVQETTDHPPKTENEQQQLRLVMPTLKSSEVTSSAEEGVANGSRTMKLPRSCNPVIGSAAALDKSKLRKVTDLERQQIQKPDERDSLLEQIRAKSFNLKPAVVSRPSVRGPNTNLKVAAILQKANAIRQALAGSDEDDEDNWSDS